MQKFTRPLTREIELAGERLALTLSEKGLSVRSVGSRRPPREVSWSALMCSVALGRSSAGEPSADEVAQAVQALKGGAAREPSAPTAAEPSAAKPPEEPAPAPAASGVAALLARLEKWLGQHRPRFLRALRPGASAEQLDALQSALGRPLPDDLRTLLAWHNGQGDDFAGCFEENWFLMDTGKIEADWKEQTGAAGARWKPEWVPFLDDDRDNYTFLDTAQTPAPVRQFWDRGPEQPSVAPSLAAWLHDYVAAVERGEYTQEPERGVFMRKREG